VTLDNEKDAEVLRQAAKLLLEENQRLVAKTVALQRENLRLKGLSPDQLQQKIQQLEQQLAQRNQMLFGRSSEKRASQAPTEPKPQKKQTGHGPREQKKLPIREEVFTLDQPDKQCPQCGGSLAEMKGQFEESEDVTVVERQFVLRKIKRQKYRCSCGGCVETAIGPAKLFPGARYSVDFAVEVAIQKYLDHLPLERQVRIMEREGLSVESNSLWDCLDAVAKLVHAAWERLPGELRLEAVLGADETRWPVSEKQQESKTWQVWALAGSKGVHYRILESRSTTSAEELIGDFGGTLVTDGYAVYSALQKRGRGRYVLAHCWAHVRRKFVALEDINPPEAKTVVGLIGELFEIERLCPDGPEGDEVRRRMRTERSKRIVERLDEFLKNTVAIPGSALAKAVGYTRECWGGLVRFLDDPRIPLDNNATERALRGVVLGRKNHYGSRSKRGTEVAAVLYSLLESAKLVGIEPKAYLRTAVLAALDGKQVPLPHEMAAGAEPK